MKNVRLVEEKDSYDICVNGMWLLSKYKVEDYDRMENDIDLLDNLKSSLDFDFKVERYSSEARENMRRGKFVIDGEQIRAGDFEILRCIMDQVVVFHSESRLDLDEVTYFAYHPSFDVLDYGCVYPTYKPIITIEGANEVSVEWRKVE